jgi:hypothetical protein
MTWMNPRPWRMGVHMDGITINMKMIPIIWRRVTIDMASDLNGYRYYA